MYIALEIRILGIDTAEKTKADRKKFFLLMDVFFIEKYKTKKYNFLIFLCALIVSGTYTRDHKEIKKIFL